MKNILFIVIISFTCFFQLNGKNNDNFNELINKGDSLYKEFDISSAFEVYKKAYDLDSNNYYSLLNISKVYNAVGEKQKWKDNEEKAEEYFNKAIENAHKLTALYPDSSLAYTYLAISYGNLARFVGGKEKLVYAKKIEENAKHAIKLNPNNFLPYIILGAYFREIANLSWIERVFANILYGDVPNASLEDSKKMLSAALELNPKIITANFQMALTCRALENEKLEKEHLRKVVSLPVLDFRDPYLKRRAEKILSRE